jgi:hypothetical protein
MRLKNQTTSAVQDSMMCCSCYTVSANLHALHYRQSMPTAPFFQQKARRLAISTSRATLCIWARGFRCLEKSKCLIFRVKESKNNSWLCMWRHDHPPKYWERLTKRHSVTSQTTCFLNNSGLYATPWLRRSVCRQGEPVSIPGQSKWALWCTEWRTAVVPCQYHCTNASYLFTHLPPTLYNLSNCQRRSIRHIKKPSLWKLQISQDSPVTCTDACDCFPRRNNPQWAGAAPLSRLHDQQSYPHHSR